MNLITDNDKKYVLPEPDKDFNPDRNKRIIEGTILKYEKMREKKMKDFTNNLRVRTDAVATYLKSNAVDNGKPIEKYLGKRNMKELVGAEILEKLSRLKSYRG
jgi:hypothetical protein